MKMWEQVARIDDAGDLVCVDCDSDSGRAVFACDINDGESCEMCRCVFVDGEWRDRVMLTAADELKEACRGE
jgi:hypothetical protein